MQFNNPTVHIGSYMPGMCRLDSTRFSHGRNTYSCSVREPQSSAAYITFNIVDYKHIETPFSTAKKGQ